MGWRGEMVPSATPPRRKAAPKNGVAAAGQPKAAKVSPGHRSAPPEHSGGGSGRIQTDPGTGKGCMEGRGAIPPDLARLRLAVLTAEPTGTPHATRCAAPDRRWPALAPPPTLPTRERRNQRRRPGLPAPGQTQPPPDGAEGRRGAPRRPQRRRPSLPHLERSPSWNDAARESGKPRRRRPPRGLRPAVSSGGGAAGGGGGGGG
ncbi:atherin, partial [Triticum aestivum]|uniref:atherin n=1 Tax=Triticum aestivum TaxID=4565 RepID=UPI001D01D67C